MSPSPHSSHYSSGGHGQITNEDSASLVPQTVQPITAPLMKLLHLPQEVRHSLEWWKSLDHLTAGAPFVPPVPQETVVTDVSLWGWGAHLDHLCTGDMCGPGLQAQHINFLELLVIKYAIIMFQEQLRVKAVLVISDNTTAVAYVHRQGGTVSRQLCLLTIELWELCLSEHGHFSQCHPPSRSYECSGGFPQQGRNPESRVELDTVLLGSGLSSLGETGYRYLFHEIQLEVQMVLHKRRPGPELFRRRSVTALFLFIYF